jgi:TPR repeat protein
VAAVRWYRRAAEQGLAEAQSGLGSMYYKGWGVLQDYAKAQYWYRQAAEQGDAVAQNNLGMLYRDALGVEKDEVEAYLWCALSAAGGIDAARAAVESLAARMRPEQVAEGEKRAKAWLAAHPKK